MIMSKKVKIDLTGTYEESMDEIDNAPITDEFKVHLREEYHKIIQRTAHLFPDRKAKNTILYIH